MDHDTFDEPVREEPGTPLERLREQLVRSDHYTGHEAAELDAYLGALLATAAVAEPEVLTVMNPVSRPVRLKLAVILVDDSLDSMYGKERAELAVSDEGVCYLVYRRSDGGDYAVVWSPATLMSPSTMLKLPPLLAGAMWGGAR